MLKCPELSKLPKTSKVSSLLFRRQCPGTIRGPNFEGVVDPTHPGARSKMGEMPFFGSKAIRITVTPFSLMAKPPFVSEPFLRPIDTWQARIERSAEQGLQDPVSPIKLANQKPGRTPFSFLYIASKAGVHKSAVIRSTTLRRLRTALNLVFIRDATVQNGKLRLENKPSAETPLRGWAYVFIPTLECYRMPYTELVPLIRKAMITLRQNALALEQKWKQKSVMESRKVPQPRHHNGPLDTAETAPLAQPKPISASDDISKIRAAAHFDPWASPSSSPVDETNKVKASQRQSWTPLVLPKWTSAARTSSGTIESAKRKMFPKRPIVKIPPPR
ncbi:hypothetical protein C8J56DRAFT_1061572 [Mycena floridula]|nr:hypothetical protein C8J56DRAFT_1061572 [Mycena floridula]